MAQAPDPVAEYTALLDQARSVDTVVGVIVVGPRAVGELVATTSDVDVYVITRGEDDAGPWRTPHGSPVEVWPMPIAEFRDHAMPGTRDAWNRPTFLRTRVDLDRLDGEIAQLVARKARLEADEAGAIAAAALDDYVNSLYRSLRNLEAGRALAGRLDAVESIGAALTTAFAFEERVRPFNKWLVHELAARPLEIADLLDHAERIARDPTPDAQRALYRVMESAARARGHGAVIDGWEPDVAWLRGDGGDRGDRGDGGDQTVSAG